MKLLTTTTEERAYSEQQANERIAQFRQEASANGYVVKSAGWTHKEKKKKGEVVAEAWIVKCVAVYNAVWEDDE